VESFTLEVKWEPMNVALAVDVPEALLQLHAGELAIVSDSVYARTGRLNIFTRRMPRTLTLKRFCAGQSSSIPAESCKSASMCCRTEAFTEYSLRQGSWFSSWMVSSQFLAILTLTDVATQRVTHR
jgi:hypothetical protein